MLRSKKLRRTAACEYLKETYDIERSPSTLAKYACIGGGPRFIHDGRFPLYPLEELDSWAATVLSPLKISTSDKS